MLSSSLPYTWVTPGYASSVELDLTDLGGFTGTPNLTVTSPLPVGITAVLNPNTPSTRSYTNPRVNSGVSYIGFIGDDSVTPGDNIVTVAAQSGTAVETRSVYLQVKPVQFRLDIQPSLTHLMQGSSVQMTVSAIKVVISEATRSISVRSPRLFRCHQA